MYDLPLFYLFLDKHIGIGIRWSSYSGLFLISFSIPFITIQLNFGTYIE
jgi:hypothetical protein